MRSLGRRRAGLLLLCVATTGPRLRGQDPGPPQPLGVAEAIAYADAHYPAIAASLAHVDATRAGVDVAHAAYLPRLDSLWQSNRATFNNLAGQILPQSVFPSLSGPVAASASADSVWGTTAGALLTWEPLDLGLRHADMTRAERAVDAARAEALLTRLDVEHVVAAAFLEAVAADQVVIAAQADLDRRGVLATSVHALVTNELRPGADGSRADAERANAEVRLLRAQQARDLARVDLARALGSTAATLTPAGDVVLQLPSSADAPPADPDAHPLARVREAALEASHADEDAIARTDRPRLYLESSVFGRGSGIDPTGTVGRGWRGLGFDRANWAAGFQIVLPNVFDLSTKHARQAAAAATSREATARRDETRLAVSASQEAAAVRIRTAQAIAASTPTALAAARLGEAQARARYDAGLAPLVEVADAEGLLAQAEVQDRLARLEVWRALLDAAVARGDLSTFVALVRRQPHGS